MDDLKRLELLRLLEANSRLTPTQLAAMLAETPETVTAAIAALEEQRVILTYGAVVDWDKAGSNKVTAMIEVKITPQRDTGFDRLSQRIARFPEVRSCYLMSGTYDLMVEVEAANIKEVSRFVSERLSAMDGVSSTTTHFVMKVYKHDGVAYGETEPDNRLAVTP